MIHWLGGKATNKSGNASHDGMKSLFLANKASKYQQYFSGEKHVLQRLLSMCLFHRNEESTKMLKWREFSNQFSKSLAFGLNLSRLKHYTLYVL